MKRLPVLVFASKSTIESERLELYFDYLSIRLDPQKVAGNHVQLNLDFTDTKEKYLLDEWGVLTYYEGGQATDPDAKVTLTREALNRVLEGKSKLDDELKSRRHQGDRQEPAGLR